MKVLIIPDVHLKPWIFDQAEDIMRDKGFDRAVFIGDLVDDWDHESDVGLYEETLKRAVEFAKDHPDMLWCYGNHDLAYLWYIEDHPGFSEDAQDVVCEYFNMLEDTLESPENMAVMHRIDNVLFSHAGLVRGFVDDYLDDIRNDIDAVIDTVNGFDQNELWDDISPVWARPQYRNGFENMYPPEFFQVVGHTPVSRVLKQGNLLTTDTFSTTRDGRPIGNNEFCWVDTITKEAGTIE